LAVFAGGFSLFAVESVAGNDQGATPLVLLSSLLEKSLLRRLPDGQVGAGTAAEEPRFGMLETVREFGLERLAASGEEAAARWAHAAFVLALLREFERSWYEPAATGRRGGWGRERDNVRATLAWLERTGTAEEALELAVAAGVFWYCHGVGDGRRWLGRLLRRGDRAPSATRAMALMWASNLAAKQGTASRRSRWRASRWRSPGAASGDHASLSEALCALGGALRDRGRAAESGPLFAEAWEIFRARGMAAHGAHALLNLGLLAEEEGDPARAAALCAEALALRRQLGQPVGWRSSATPWPTSSDGAGTERRRRRSTGRIWQPLATSTNPTGSPTP
jgi:non-specific serine/threonine protein kinase